MRKIKVQTTKNKEVLDITEEINGLISIDRGLCTISLSHSTAALTTADLDPGTDLDMLDAFEAMMPKLDFRHPHDPEHVPDHIWSSIIGTSVSLPVENGKLILGTWQRLVLIEFNGPREREVVVTEVTESA